MFVIYGYVNTGTDVSGVWTVGFVTSEKEAKSLVVRMKDEAIRIYQAELENGFDLGDSISIVNHLDPHAHYISYDRETRSPEIAYFYTEVSIIDEEKSFDDITIRKLQGDDLPESIKYDDDCKPIGDKSYPYEYYESRYLSNIALDLY